MRLANTPKSKFAFDKELLNFAADAKASERARRRRFFAARNTHNPGAAFPPK
jgi:hypothetical protein